MRRGSGNKLSDPQEKHEKSYGKVGSLSWFFRPSPCEFALGKCVSLRRPRSVLESALHPRRPNMRALSRCLVLAIVSTTIASAQSQVAPTNSAPNPYETIEGWAKMPEGRTWGATSAVDIDTDGKSIWVAERCGANN